MSRDHAQGGRRSARLAERIALIPALAPPVAIEVAEARAAVLRRFVIALYTGFADLWPEAVAPAVRSAAPPWPKCWEEHPGFVVKLQLLHRWYTDLMAGDTPGDPNVAVSDWFDFLLHQIVPHVAIISEQICRTGHLDPAVPRPRPEPQLQSQPPLPGEHPPDPPPPPVSPGWQDASASNGGSHDLE